MNPLIPFDRSVVVAMDVPTLARARGLAMSVANVPGIGGFKVGFELGYGRGLAAAVDTIKSGFDKKTTIILDHQKAGNDIPEMGKRFARVAKDAGCDAVILFPFAGPITQEVWTKSCQDAGLHVLVGGTMTHKGFLQHEGGYLASSAPGDIFRRGCRQGVVDFVVPGTKLDALTVLRNILVEELGEGNFTLSAPGLITQGGDISECGKAAGKRFHAIVGSAIYGKEGEDLSIAQMRENALNVTRQIA